MCMVESLKIIKKTHKNFSFVEEKKTIKKKKYSVTLSIRSVYPNKPKNPSHKMLANIFSQKAIKWCAMSKAFVWVC